MATVLGVGVLVGVLGALVSAPMAIAGRADPVKRRRWNGWLLGSVGLALVCIVGFLLLG